MRVATPLFEEEEPERSSRQIEHDSVSFKLLISSLPSSLAEQPS